MTLEYLEAPAQRRANKVGVKWIHGELPLHQLLRYARLARRVHRIERRQPALKHLFREA
jgi:hypothetical protein